MSAADAMPSSTADQPIIQSVEQTWLTRTLAEGEIGPHPEIVKVIVLTQACDMNVPTSGVFTVTVGSNATFPQFWAVIMEATGLLTDWFTAMYEEENEDKCQLYRETHFKTLTENGDVWKSGRALQVTLHMLRGDSSDNNLPQQALDAL